MNPINVTLLFSREHYVAATQAYLRGIAPDTINTIPDKTLLAFAEHGKLGAVLPFDGGYGDAVLEEFRHEGVDDEALAQRLQREGVKAFAQSWRALLARIEEKTL